MSISTIGICGAGTMGRGIVLAAIQNGFDVVLWDISADAQEPAEKYIHAQLDKAVQRGKMTEEGATAARSRVFFTTSLTSMSNADIVIEAVLERKDVKDSLFSQLEEIVSEETILATNTSSISVTVLSRILKHPGRFVGMHFFNPAHIMKLVEVIRGARTEDTVVQQTVALAERLGRKPAIARDVPGFIVNRVARNYYNEAMRICTEGAAEVEQVDRILKGAGFKMGPFELMDLIGVDTNYEVTVSVWNQYLQEPRFTPSLMQQEAVAAGMHGRKTGEGFYKY